MAAEITSYSTTLPYSYAALASNDDFEAVKKQQRRRSLKIVLLMFSMFMLCALFIIFLDDVNHNNNNNNNNNNNSNMANNLPSHDDLNRSTSSDGIVHVISRGKAYGVSEKASGLPQRGFALPFFDWNDLQLTWQRTAFHFRPQKNWMSDPNGPLYYNGWYHFFYQYNPEAAVWGNIVWGHSVSKDLINWIHLPITLVSDHWYDINGVWTGSATILPDGQIMMLYTGSTKDSVQVANLAYPANLSDPFLRDWVKYPGNPVLFPPPGIDKLDFRDPSTAWMTSEGKWRITLGSKINRTGISLVYDTTDFIHFELRSNILHAVPTTGMWECVDFYPVSLSEPNGLDTSTNGPLLKHVLKASMDDERIDYYTLGTYNEVNGTWTPDNAEIDVGIGIRYDYGKFYASTTFYDQEKKRRVLWGYITEGDSEAVDVKRGWASLQAIPRTVLYDQKTGTNLIQWPVEEVETLRHNSKQFDQVEVPAGSVVPLNVTAATEIDIMAEFTLKKEALEKLPVSGEHYSCPASKGAAQRGSIGPFGLLVLANNDLSEQTPVYFYVVKTSNARYQTFFCTDLSRSSKATYVIKEIYGSTVPVLKGEKLSMRILVDHSIVEAFAQGGRSCITSRVYPTKAIYKDTKLYLFNNATAASVTASIKTWQMSSARALSY